MMSTCDARQGGRDRCERSITDKSQTKQMDEYERTFSPDPSESIANNPLLSRDVPAPKSWTLCRRTTTVVNLDCERSRTLTTRAAAKMMVAWLRAIAASVPQRMEVGVADVVVGGRSKLNGLTGARWLRDRFGHFDRRSSGPPGRPFPSRDWLESNLELRERLRIKYL